LLEPYYSAQKIQNTIDGLNEYAFPNIDWYREMFKSKAINQYYNFNVSGGGSVVRYYMAVPTTRRKGSFGITG